MKSQLFLLILLVSTLNSFAFAGEKNPQVSIKDYKFIPQIITIKRGQTIQWNNREKRQYHSVWFEKSGEEEPDYIFPDENYQREFKQAGSFSYRCGPHPEMTGTVQVTE